MYGTLPSARKVRQVSAWLQAVNEYEHEQQKEMERKNAEQEREMERQRAKYR